MPSSYNDLMAGGGGAGPNSGVPFQAYVGSLFTAGMLAGAVLPEAARLGAAKVSSIKFETEAPVDDILLATDRAGYLAIQVKTTVRASRRLDSPFGKTIEQFVRHWIVCRDGNGDRGWNRPLDFARDRLVLAIGPDSSDAVLKDLPSGLRARSDPGAPMLTAEERKVLDAFDAVVSEAWASVTSESQPEELITELNRLVSIIKFDPTSNDLSRALEAVLLTPQDAPGVEAQLRALMGEWMRDRRGGEAGDVKGELERRGVRFDAPPDFRADIAKLKNHSASTAEALRRFEVIEAGGAGSVSVSRDCQPIVDAAAAEESLLIVGEPGAGKSGVLSALVTGLQGSGRQVLELAVDRHSVETLDGLRLSLGLHHPLIEVLKAWDSPDGRWLVIDALDAARGGGGQDVFRDLIKQVMEETRHWRVVATIRTFDLRLGRQFRELFKGVPPAPSLVESGLGGVRHISIPPWSDDEFRRLRSSIPALDTALVSAGQKLTDLARVPFNSRLLVDLVTEGQIQLGGIETQVQLLGRYWEHRVEALGAPARAVLRVLVARMVQDRMLQAPESLFDAGSSAVLASLSRAGIVISIDNGRRVQFRHHLLFDYAASRVFLDPDELLIRPGPFAKEDAPGLMLAPAVTFLFHELWSESPGRERFWSAVANLATDRDADPVIRSVAGRMGVSHPAVAEDVEVLAARVQQDDAHALGSLGQLVGALTVRFEDDPTAPLEPWSRLAARLAGMVDKARHALHGLVFLLTTRAQEASTRLETGLAARALLTHALDGDNAAVGPIGFVVETFDTDPEASRTLLRRLFETKRFEARAWEDIPAITYKIDKVTEHDPQFTAEIYRRVFAGDVVDETKTSLGHSQILPLSSTARQDFDMARYSLTEHFPTFFKQAPTEAAAALVEAVEGYVARAHRPTEDVQRAQFTVNGADYVLKADHSYIWAHDVEKAYGHDADALLVKFIEAMEGATEPVALRVVEEVSKRAVHAVVWARLFLIGSRRGGVVADYLWPFAAHEAALVMPDTRKDAVDLVARAAPARSTDELTRLETAALEFGFDEFMHPVEAREALLIRLFSAIGAGRLQTSAAKAVLDGREDDETVKNDRLYRINTWSGVPDPFHWIKDLDQQEASNAALIAAVEPARKRLGLDAHDFATALDPVAAMEDLLLLETVLAEHHEGNPSLRAYVEGAVGQGLVRTLRSEAFGEDMKVVEAIARLLASVATSTSPETDPETEARFAQSPAWSSPAPRVDAAEALPELVVKAPLLWPTLKPIFDRLLADPHPAVRMQAATRLLRFWTVKPEAVWSYLSERLAVETNPGVIDYVVAGVLGRLTHSAPEQVESLTLLVLARFPHGPESLLGHLADIMTILAVTHERDAAMALVQQWAAEPVRSDKQLRRVLMTLRHAVVLGLRKDDAEEQAQIRHRAQAVYGLVVDAAARQFDEAPPAPWDDAWTQRLRSAAQTLDVACRELYFAVGGGRSDGDKVVLEEAARKTFLSETAPIMRRIGDHGTPHTIHYLLQSLERFVGDDPAGTFDLTAHALLNGGRNSGYAFESLGADLAVRLIGRFLADHREIFTADRRRCLVECLETFIDAGWPAARRLLYDLPELMQ